MANINFWGQIIPNQDFWCWNKCQCSSCWNIFMCMWENKDSEMKAVCLADDLWHSQNPNGQLRISFLNRLPLKALSCVLRKNERSSLSPVQESRQSSFLFTLHAFSFSFPFRGVNSNQLPQNVENKQVFFVMFSWNLFSNNSDLLGLFRCHSSHLLQRWSEDKIQSCFYKHALGFFQLTVTSCLHTMGSNRFCVGSEIYREVEKTLETATALLLLFPFLFTGKSVVI